MTTYDINLYEEVVDIQQHYWAFPCSPSCKALPAFFIIKEKKRGVRAFQHANFPIFHGLTEERKNKLVFTRAEINEIYVDQIYK